MNRLRLPFVLVTALVLMLLTHLGGCVGPSYYAQAISGHLGLMRSRVEIADLLADPATDPELAKRLRKTENMRQFAQDKLALPESRSYSRFAVTSREAVTWNVVAAPEFSLEPRLWCFPVAGCVSYRGYFHQDQAIVFANKMKSQSFDVMISPAVAYSTLGWFEDPLLDTMLQYSDEALAGIMFHELAHERLYVKNDTTFNEAFASFVEATGVRLWLSHTGQASELGEWKSRRLASIQFNSLLIETSLQLREVYATDQPDDVKRQAKMSIFGDLRAEYQALVVAQWKGKDYFASWMVNELNNAHLALMNSYEGGMCAFAAMFEESGQDLERFYILADEKVALDKAQRQAWLNSPCTEFASVHDSRQFGELTIPLRSTHL